MTLLDKQGPSTAKGGESDGEHIEQDHAGHNHTEPSVPPSYAASMEASTSRDTSSSSRGLPAPCNFTSIRKKYDTITGAWTIDTNLQVPEALLRPLEEGQLERPNLSLRTMHGSIRADVALISGTRERAYIDLDAWHGKVHLRVLSRINAQPLKLRASAGHGQATIYLPPDFVGPLKYQNRYGKITFSQDLHSHLQIITEDTAFLGNLQSSGFVDFKTWEGDEVEIKMGHGKINLFYSTELPIESSQAEQQCKPEEAGAKLKKRRGFFGRR